ncbi:MAG: endonuclease Q family protein, partial [Patescibacteria group bacterium]
MSRAKDTPGVKENLRKFCYSNAMRYITDFHIHSKYSRACSKELVPEKLHEWAQYKGIDILGTGDFTHPLWLKELEEKLVPVEAGFFQLNPKYEIRNPKQSGKFRPVRFMLTAEVASIYSQGGKLRRIHTVLVAPSFEVVKKINKELANLGNLTSDGRPILGLSAKGLAQIAFEADPTCLVIPAHAWTPWFSVFGSKSGFDSLAECYEELTPQIFAIETGLSSDPEMNWRLETLDQIALTSSSDAHSLPNLGREATVFELATPTYTELVQALRSKNIEQLLGTIEFYPEEGKYHYDGHAACKVVLAPSETKRQGG